MKALITGITGQTGSYLAEILLERGYEVHGLVRRASTINTSRIDHLYQDPHEKGCKLFLHYGDLADASCVASIITDVMPDEVYNLAAQSHVRVSFDIPVSTFDVTATGALRVLEAIRKSGKDIKFYQASSSEMFGDSPPPQNESTPFRPCSPYACAKVAAYHLTNNYRKAYGMFACNGILFNHESERRGETFVTRKISKAAAAIKRGLQDKIYLGNILAKRDWGYARDYAEAIYAIMQHDAPDDYVVATGDMHSVSDFLRTAFELLNLSVEDHLRIDDRYLRPSEVNALCGDYSKIKRTIGWEPQTSFEDLVRIMVESDLREVDSGTFSP